MFYFGFQKTVVFPQGAVDEPVLWPSMPFSFSSACLNSTLLPRQFDTTKVWIFVAFLWSNVKDPTWFWSGTDGAGVIEIGLWGYMHFIRIKRAQRDEARVATVGNSTSLVTTGFLWPYFRKWSSELVVTEWLKESRLAEGGWSDGKQAFRNILTAIKGASA